MTYSWSVLRISVARLILILATSLLLSSSHADTVFGQSLSGFDRGNAKAMLDILKGDIKNNYYDKSFRGIDLDKRFKDAELALNEAQTRDQLMAIVAQPLIDFNDSHTVFIPPSRSSMIQYGWQMQMIGDYGFITEVRPGSDAEAKGLKRGDVILSVDGFQPDRANMWKMLYRYYAIMPSRSVNLVVQSPYESKTRSLDILSKIKPGKAVVDYGDLFVRYLSQERDIDHDRDYEIGDDVFIWKMPTFEVSSDHVDALMNKASKYKTLILDLRSNSGGYVQTLERLAGYFIEKDTKIAELKGRKVMKPLMAKSRGDKSFKGKLIVLVDSGSASASEVFARFCQLE